MAKKTTMKKAATPVKKAEKGNKNMMLIAVVAVIVIAAVALYFAFAGGGGKKGGETSGGTNVVPATGAGLPSSTEAIDGMFESLGGVQKATVRAEGTVMMAAEGQQMEIGVQGLLKYDKANKRSYTQFTASVPGAGEQVSESYTIGNITYMQLQDPITREFSWVKEEGANAWGALGNFSLEGLSDALGGQVVGTESKNGKGTIKLSVQPDVAKLADFLIGSQLEQLAASGMTQEDIDAGIGQLVDAVKSASGVIWLDKVSLLPVALDIQAAVDLNTEGTAGVAVSIGIDMSVNIDYDSPISIELPAMALNAIVTQTCTDSDGGLNYYLKGTTASNNLKSNNLKSIDSCFDSTLLQEYECWDWSKWDQFHYDVGASHQLNLPLYLYDQEIVPIEIKQDSATFRVGDQSGTVLKNQVTEIGTTGIVIKLEETYPKDPAQGEVSGVAFSVTNKYYYVSNYDCPYSCRDGACLKVPA